MQSVWTIHAHAATLPAPMKGKTMDNNQQPKQPKGNFIASPPRYKPTNNRPDMSGTISIPGTEREFRIGLYSFTYTDKDGVEQIGYSGSSHDISRNDDAMTQLKAIAGRRTPSEAVSHKGLTLQPGGIAIFTNGFKEEAGVDKELLDKRPQFNGYWNPGNGEPIVNIAIWPRVRKDDNVVILGGETSYPLPGKVEGKEQTSEPTMAPAAEPAPRTRARRSRDMDMDQSM